LEHLPLAGGYLQLPWLLLLSSAEFLFVLEVRRSTQDYDHFHSARTNFYEDTCHINHKNSLAGFWIPLLVFAGLTVIIQFVTFGYCIKVYLASLADDSNTTQSSGLPSYTNSVKTVSPRQAYRRVRRVLELQWRGIAIVILIITDVIFFAVVFVYLDNNEAAVLTDQARAEAWLLCLVEYNGNKNKCLDLAGPLVVNDLCINHLTVYTDDESVQWHLATAPYGSLFDVCWLVSIGHEQVASKSGVC
jgi:hypothetical protein